MTLIVSPIHVPRRFQEPDVEREHNGDTASLSSGEWNCFDAVLDTIEVISIDNTTSDEDKATKTSAVKPTSPRASLEKVQDTNVTGAAEELLASTALPPSLLPRSTNRKCSEILPEYSRLRHNDRGQRDRRRKMWEGRQARLHARSLTLSILKN